MTTEDFMIEAGILPEPADRTEEWKTTIKVTHCLIHSNHLFLGFIVDMNFVNFGKYPVSFAQGCWDLIEHHSADIKKFAKSMGFSLTELHTTIMSPHFDHVHVDALIRRLGEIASTTASGELEIDL